MTWRPNGVSIFMGELLLGTTNFNKIYHLTILLDNYIIALFQLLLGQYRSFCFFFASHLQLSLRVRLLSHALSYAMHCSFHEERFKIQQAIWRLPLHTGPDSIESLFQFILASSKVKLKRLLQRVSSGKQNRYPDIRNTVFF